MAGIGWESIDGRWVRKRTADKKQRVDKIFVDMPVFAINPSAIKTHNADGSPARLPAAKMVAQLSNMAFELIPNMRRRSTGISPEAYMKQQASFDPEKQHTQNARLSKENATVSHTVWTLSGTSFIIQLDAEHSHVSDAKKQICRATGIGTFQSLQLFKIEDGNEENIDAGGFTRPLKGNEKLANGSVLSVSVLGVSKVVDVFLHAGLQPTDESRLLLVGKGDPYAGLTGEAKMGFELFGPSENFAALERAISRYKSRRISPDSVSDSSNSNSISTSDQSACEALAEHHCAIVAIPNLPPKHRVLVLYRDYASLGLFPGPNPKQLLRWESMLHVWVVPYTWQFSAQSFKYAGSKAARAREKRMENMGLRFRLQSKASDGEVWSFA